MQESDVISAYVERLARALDFDPSLSRCVRREVEDHLWETVAADPTGDRLEAARRAVAHFGDPHVIAAQFTVVSLAKQARRVGVAAVLVIAAVFIVMKARLTWYAVMQGPAVDQMGALGGIVGSIDRYAFCLRRGSGLGVYRQPPYSRSLHSGISQTAASILSPVLCGNGRPDRVGHQRRRSHVPSSGRNKMVSRFSDSPHLDGDRSRMCGYAGFVYPRYDAANGVHGSHRAHGMKGNSTPSAGVGP
jgi:hypothetical protein